MSDPSTTHNYILLTSYCICDLLARNNKIDIFLIKVISTRFFAVYFTNCIQLYIRWTFCFAGNDNFIESSDVLITWLARGDCNRRSASVFYSMIQIVNSHVRRLMSDKDHHDQELMELKEKFKERIQHIIAQCKLYQCVYKSLLSYTSLLTECVKKKM